MCTATKRAVYTREELLALSRIGRGIKQLKAKRHNRRWRYKPFLPSVIMRNSNSLPNKCNGLEVRNQRLYKESSNNTPDSCVDIPGFTAVPEYER